MTPLEEKFAAEEAKFNISAPLKAYTIIRVDGRSFSKYTRGLVKPFDMKFLEHMDAAADALVKEFHATHAYTNSDEISILLTDFETWGKEPPFRNRLQKLTSIAASTASVAFSQLREKPAIFDARVISLKTKEDTIEYFKYRASDCRRNAIQMLAYHNFSSKQLHKVSVKGQLELLSEKGLQFEDLPLRVRVGSALHKVPEEIVAPDGSTITRMRNVMRPSDDYPMLLAGIPDIVDSPTSARI